MSFFFAEGKGRFSRLSVLCLLLLGVFFFGQLSTTEAAASFKDRMATMGAVKGVRTSVTNDKSRLVVDISREIVYETMELSNPDRIVIDMHGTWIGQDVPRSMSVDNRFIKAIRIAQHDADTVRMVVETKVGRNNYDIFGLTGGSSPYRIVIDVGNLGASTNASTIDFSANNNAANEGVVKQDTEAKAENTVVNPAAQRTTVDPNEPSMVRQDTEAPAGNPEAAEAKDPMAPAENSDSDATAKAAAPEANTDTTVAVRSDSNKEISVIPEKPEKPGEVIESVYAPGVEGKTIVIDPGHGGSDVGAIGPTGVTEKSVTLRVALQVQKQLQESGANVIMTRESDIEVSPKREDATDAEELQARCDIANKVKADIFISIHMDSFSNSTPTGTTGYYYGNGSKTSMKLSASISEGVMKQLGTSYRGNKTCNFYVVKHTNMPATLVEMAFISNKGEEKLMNSDEGIKKAANGIVKGIGEFFS